MTTYKQAVKAIAWVVFFHILGLIALYSWYPHYDIFMHFAGGLAVAVLAFALFDHNIKTISLTHKNKIYKRLFYFVMVVGFTMMIGVGWEWYEFISDNVMAPEFGWLVAQTSVIDTMKDLLFDFCGATCVVLWRGL
jgi:hypothetical protein